MPASEITYRKATLNDIPTLIDNRILFAIELNGQQPQAAINELRAYMADYFQKAIPANTSISILAECDYRFAGMGTVEVRVQPGNFKNPSGRWGYIMTMYTVPEFRRRGICKNILQQLVDEAGKEKVMAFELHATKEGEMVYRQEGFEMHNEPTYRKFVK